VFTVRATASREQLLALSHRERSTSLYLLVDPVMGDPISEEPARRSAIALPIRHPELKDAYRPYLVRLGDFGRDRTIEKSIAISTRQAMRDEQEKSLGRTVCGWLAVDGPVNPLASHLSNCARVHVQQEVKLLRFWDPRVLDLLAALLKPAQVDALLGPALSWSWLARDGSLRSLVQRAPPTSAVDGARTFRLERSQINALLQAEYVNRTLDVLQDMGHDVVADDVAAGVSRLVARGARDWSLVSDRDRVTFALYGMLVGDGFDRVPEVHEVMSQALMREQSPIEALDRFEQSYWEKLGQVPGFHPARAV
jgi:hypothetical protein